MQPDFGQTMLIVLVWSALFFMAGMRLIWVFGLAGIAGVGLTGAYFTVPHVARRIQRFLNPASGDTFNIDIATESFMRGGWFGRGPGEGTVKRLLPESHTDFVFAVAAEEFGVALCLALVALFAFIVIRALVRAMRNDDPFTRFAAAGLAILFGTQSAINMAVNLHLIPAKGMTLPFISYGGSSMISLAYAMGMLLALTREQPRAAMLTPDSSAAACLIALMYGRQAARSLLERWLMPQDDGAAPLGAARAPAAPAAICFRREALAVALHKRGAVVELATDAAPRISNFPRAPSTSSRARPCAAAIRSRWRAPARCSRSAPPRRGRCSAASRPAVVVGFGGYPTVPPLLAASLRGIPTVLHEQNGVMGRANRLLAPRVTTIATGFRTLTNARSALAGQDRPSPAIRCGRR